MSKRNDLELLCDALEAVERIIDYIEGLSYDNFIKDSKTQDAVVRNFEIIGEAAKVLSADIRKKYPNIPWKKLAGLRDRLIHHYFGINFDVVWNAAEVELPGFCVEIKKIIKIEKSS